MQLYHDYYYDTTIHLSFAYTSILPLHSTIPSSPVQVAQQYFQLLGASASECDTIPGRQCMASCFFILRQFDDVLIYLSSIEAYFPNDSTFHYNYAIARAAAGKHKEAEQACLFMYSVFHSRYIYCRAAGKHTDAEQRRSLGVVLMAVLVAVAVEVEVVPAVIAVEVVLLLQTWLFGGCVDR